MSPHRGETDEQAGDHTVGAESWWYVYVHVHVV